jgi:cyclopropane fatty-acyl-phospholipid synthase-like methyltransferase
MDEKAKYERIYETPGAVWTTREPRRELAELVESGQVRPCRALDIGCGEGFFSIYLASKGFDVLGIDLSDKAIGYARQNAEEAGVKAEFRQMDFYDLERLKERFGFVLEWSILHTMPFEKRQAYVRSVANLLEKGGRYLSVCFNIKSPQFGGPGKRVRKTPYNTNLYFSSEDELKALFEPHFNILESKIIKVYKTSHPGGVDHLGNYFLLEKK